MTDPTPTETAALVARVRARHGLTQAKLAALLDPPVSPNAVSQWQNGVHRPGPAYLLQLRRLVGESDEAAETPTHAAGVAGWRLAVAHADDLMVRLGPGEIGYKLAEQTARLGRATLKETFGVDYDAADEGSTA